ncbi:hypothetical protein [Nocardioides antri]|uniref:Uncharacterized protein n=1 Tax=Nocardioides antri TaxID=2607659 RepID=A0A5B1MA20_9ACTN|nr:hypothetical protein [Nocardioides antri]KAA1428767.1 hypothetical protein F0U47_00660 [Nocardioides antri]
MVTRLRLLGSLFVVVTALSFSACGASDGGKGEPGAGDPAQDPDAAALAWAKCMRENGVDIPDPKPADDGKGGDVGLAPGLGGPMPGVDAEAFAAAKEACAEHAEGMGGVDGGGFTEEDKQRMVDFARCMREHGVDMPDPDFDGGDGEMGVEIDPNDSDFEAAQEACREFSFEETQ